MSTHISTPFTVSGLPIDPRIRVFRRLFSAQGEFDELQVDAYGITTERFIIICDTLLCPEDGQFMLHTLQDKLAGRQLLVIERQAARTSIRDYSLSLCRSDRWQYSIN